VEEAGVEVRLYTFVSDAIVEDGVVKEASLVAGGVAPVPYALPETEQFLIGKKITGLKYITQNGIYNFTDEGECSWYDFAQLIGRYGGRTCDIRPCHSGEFPSKVKRPAYSVLDKSKIKQCLSLRIPHWTESLQLCINHLNKH